MRAAHFAILLTALLWAGCEVGPNYHAPKVSGPTAFGESNSFVNTNDPVAEWWRTFHDRQLNQLIDTVLASNFDLQIATARVRESRAQRNLAAADLWPQADANGSYIHSRGSKNIALPLGGASGQSTGPQAHGGQKLTRDASSGAPGVVVTPNPFNQAPSPLGQGGLPGATTDIYQAGFDASWEIDIFGGKRRQVEAASAEVESLVESRRSLQVSLAAEAARDYLELRGSQERLRIARENLAAQQSILELTKSKRGAGLANDLDVLRAAAEVSATSAALPPLEAACRGYIHALSTLTGQEPNQLAGELTEVRPLPLTPPEVPVGLPSQLVQRRADIRQAEREIAAANARIGSAQSDLFPKFALVGSMGLDASQPGNLINWDSRYFLISPSVTWRIFDAGRIAANIRLQKANEEEAALQYRGTILKALREVEDALVNYASEHSRRAALADEVKQNQDALKLARQRYDQGLGDFLNVLDIERSTLSAQDQLAASDVSISIDLVALYKSLGGGWK